jgi:site-specific recombinase XerD
VAKLTRPAAPTLEAAWASFDRALRAQNRSPQTRRAYGQSVAQLVAFLGERRAPLGVDQIRREDLEAWITALLESRKPATAATRHRAIARLFSWLVEEGEIEQSPMARVKAPHVPEDRPAVLSLEDMRRLVGACRGTDFEARRDAAILRMLIDTGVRLGELAGLRVEDVDLDEDLAVVTGKGRRRRGVPLGAKTTAALDRYLRLRSAHVEQRQPALWLGQKGVMTASGIRQAVQRRAQEAGIDRRIWPHLLRHTGAHEWLAAGGSEGDLMALYGWRSAGMLRRYGASAAADRARKSHARLSLGDRV